MPNQGWRMERERWKRCENTSCDKGSKAKGPLQVYKSIQRRLNKLRLLSKFKFGFGYSHPWFLWGWMQWEFQAVSYFFSLNFEPSRWLNHPYTTGIMFVIIRGYRKGDRKGEERNKEREKRKGEVTGKSEENGHLMRKWHWVKWCTQNWVEEQKSRSQRECTLKCAQGNANKDWLMLWNRCNMHTQARSLKCVSSVFLHLLPIQSTVDLLLFAWQV